MKFIIGILSFLTIANASTLVFMVEDNKGKHIAKSTKISSYKRITSGESWHLYPDISPDSKSITYVRGGDQKSLQIVIESNQKNKVLGTRGFILQPKFSKSANLLFASKKIDGKNKIIKIDVKEMSETINAQDINGELVYPDSYQIIENENSYFPIPFQNGEKIIYQRNTDTKRIVLKNLIDNKELIIGEGMSPSLSKDEMFVAYTKKMNNNWDIHIYNLLTKKTIKVTSDKHFDFSPAFSPNGDLYYTSDRAENGVFSIFMQTKSSWQDREKFEILYLAERGTSFYAPRFSGKESYKLSSLKSMPGKARSSFGAIEHNKKVYIVGGHQGAEHTYPPESFTGRVTMFDLETKHWKNLAPRINKCHGFQLSAQGNYLYAFGGFAFEATTSPKWKSLDVVERYNIKENKWEVVNTMPRKRSSNVGATVGSKVYLMGGWDSTPKFEDDIDGIFHNEIDVYDMSTNTFETLQTKLPLKRRAFSSFVKDSRIYLVGGISEGGSHFALLDHFTEFDPFLSVFTEKKNLPFATFAPAAGNIDNKGFVFGGMLKLGKWNYEYVSHIYEYDFTKDSWMHSGRYLSEDKGFSQVVKINNTLGILGGHSYQDNTDKPVDSFEVLLID